MFVLYSTRMGEIKIFITNAEVLECQSTGIEALLIALQLSWAGHVLCMCNERIPKHLTMASYGRVCTTEGGRESISKMPSNAT